MEDRCMIKLYDTGAYLVNGTELVEDSGDAKLILRNMLGKETLNREEAAKNTIAYHILKDHNTSGNMEKLKIKFDKVSAFLFLPVTLFFMRLKNPSFALGASKTVPRTPFTSVM